MKHFTVNGVERPSPVSAQQPLKSLLDYIRETMVTDSNLISMIRVDGNELPVSEAAQSNELLDKLLSDVQSVEVFTAHPRELAEETVQTLLQFVDHLVQYSKYTADLMEQSKVRGEFEKLLDGIGTFTESLAGVKQILRIGILPSVNVLEADLLSILKDMLHFYQTGEVAYVCQLMREHLPENLELWKNEGLPELVRIRAS